MKTFHRNSDLAFPRTTKYACAVEIPVGHRPIWWHLWRWIRGML